MATSAKKSALGKKKKVNPKIPISHSRKPQYMTEAEWQLALRKQIAEKEIFTIKNLGNQPIYSDFEVHNPLSIKTYKVAIRSKNNSRNFCNCPDFKTNGLGTCKHIEAVKLTLNKKRGFKKLWDTIPPQPYSSLYLAYNDDRKIKLRIGADNQAKMQQWAKKYFSSGNEILEKAVPLFDKLLAEAKAINPGFRCYPDVLDTIIEQRSRNQRHHLVSSQGSSLLKGIVKTALFPYQQEGVLFATRAGRSIIADDMGLGKTLQAIAWSVLMQKKLGLEKAIIICPTSLKYQWKTEIEKFSDATVTVVEGNAMQRQHLYEKDSNFFKIISYHVAGNDWKYLNEMAPDIIILDEAQRIKNWRTKISGNIKRLKSTYSLTLTGTPLENNIEELYSLVQFTDPLLLGTLRNFLVKHQQTDDTGKLLGYTNLNEIGKALSGILLRRNKKEVLKQLPERMDKNLIIPITTQQMEIHEEKKDIVAKLVSRWRRTGFLSEKDRQNLLNSLSIMRMICDSTYILDQETNYQTKLDELFSILEGVISIEGEKMVIFSQWERMTRLIALELNNRGIKFENLHGGVPSKDREALFTNFNTDPDCRIFLSTDAGGVGLNLQSAAYMVNMDIPWNPAVLEQRIARIYRMGQKKNVSIINLVAQGTIEERMLEVLKFKKSIATGIFDNGEDSIFMGESKFNKLMESVEAITTQTDDAAPVSVDKDEKEEIATPLTEKEKAVQLPFDFSDVPEDKELDEKPLKEMPPQSVPSTGNNQAADDLIQQGMKFFSNFMTTLQNPEAVEQLSKSITEKDEKTGKTYLKLPVENEQMVGNALGLLAGLLKGLGK